MKDTTTLNPKLIRTDGGTQARAGLDSATVEEYAAAMSDGAKFPPVTVFYDGTRYWLGDGFHRVAAHRKAYTSGLVEIQAEVKAGTRRDAVLYAAGANGSHGLKRTSADKRRAVEVLLFDDEWSKWSNNEIAKRCGVSLDLVNRMRRESDHLNDSLSSERTVERNGQTYTMNTAAIGQNRPVPRIMQVEADTPIRAEFTAPAAPTVKRYDYTDPEGWSESVRQAKISRPIEEAVRKAHWNYYLTNFFDNLLQDGPDHPEWDSLVATNTPEWARPAEVQQALRELATRWHKEPEPAAPAFVKNPSVYAAVHQLRQLGYEVEAKHPPDGRILWSINGGESVESLEVWAFLDSVKPGAAIHVLPAAEPAPVPVPTSSTPLTPPYPIPPCPVDGGELVNQGCTMDSHNRSRLDAACHRCGGVWAMFANPAQPTYTPGHVMTHPERYPFPDIAVEIDAAADSRLSLCVQAGLRRGDAIRSPFAFNEHLFAIPFAAYQDGRHEYHAYQMIPESDFTGHEAGDYHGLAVMRGGQKYFLSGPRHLFRYNAPPDPLAVLQNALNELDPDSRAYLANWFRREIERQRIALVKTFLKAVAGLLEAEAE